METYEQLEAKWAKSNNLDPKGMVACSSGTAALHLAFEAMELPTGSAVLMPDFTMIACARAITMAGCVPTFIDCNKQLLMDKASFERRAKGEFAAVLAVHIYGRQEDMDWIHGRVNKPIVEDLAEAHGVHPHPNSDVACWSFYKNKIVRGEEGGAVWFKDKEKAAIARELRSLGFDERHDFIHRPRGHNYRMSNLHAKAILPSIALLSRNLQARRIVEQWYNNYCPKEWRLPPRHAPWVYDFRIPGITYKEQDAIVKGLQARGIQARHGFRPMHVQPEYRIASRGRQKLNSISAAVEVLYLPIEPGLTTELTCQKSFDIIRGITTRLTNPRPGS